MSEFNEEKERDLLENETNSEAASEAAATSTEDRETEEVVSEEDTTKADVDEETQEVGDPKMSQYDETFVTLEPGQVVVGKVVQINPDEVMVDVGYKSEGRIPLHELGLRSGQKPEEVVSVGDEIDVQVLKVEDAEGNVLLSKRRAANRQAWEELEAMHESGEVIEARVTERVKGGLLVDVGVRGFVPASHVDRNYVENLEQYIGETLRLKIVELDRQRNNVVLSRKEVLEEEYLKAKAETFDTLQEGVIVSGVVRRITDFGAFVDIGSGVEGLLHVSEMAWSRVRHPSDVLAEGDEINVMVLSVDRDKERISLSLKETLKDPWDDIGDRYREGDLVEGEVTRVVDFGAFVKLEDGVEGLVHISQLADRHVANPEEIVSSGQEVKVKVVSLDAEGRRIGLSMKDAQPKQERQPRHDPTPRSYDSGENDSLTLGDVFGDLGAMFGNSDDDEEN